MAAVGPDLPTTFGKYYLTEKLATGGMAEIYLAKLIGPGGFEKPIVIKQIHPRLSGQRHFVDLFVAEAKTLVALAHGNIVPVYELGVVDDTYFIAMDYIDGPTLYRLTETMAGRDARMEPAIAAWITARILDGLDYAHRKGEGVIHRDLSPRNVMMSRDGEVKLVDFGIAVTLGEPGEDEGSQSAPTGSFPYMSPEQVRREALGPQTDLFSVGVLFWEMLAGKRLFARRDADATLAAVLEEPIPRPSEQRPEIPARLDELVMRALERDQDARWPNAGEMRDAINRYLYSLEATPGPQDIAALVARFCPPETRRLPTHLEAIAHEAEHTPPPSDLSGPRTKPVALPDDAEPAPAPGPHTAVIPRDGSQPRGKRPRRHQTFATHVELQDLMERAGTKPPDDDTGPASNDASGPLGEISTDDRSDPTPLPPPTTRRPQRPTTERPDLVEDDAGTGDAEAPPHRPGVALDRPPSRAILLLAGVIATVLAVAAIYVFYQRRDALLREDAAVPEDVAGAPADTDDTPPVDAEVPADAADEPTDAAPDAATALRRDAAAIPEATDGGRPHAPRDAGSLVARPDATVRPDGSLVGRPDAGTHATATIKIGATPWAKVYIDGVKQPRDAPREYKVTAGHHEIRLVFDAESPALEKTYSIDVAEGETQSFTHDFTH